MRKFYLFLAILNFFILLQIKSAYSQNIHSFNINPTYDNFKKNSIKIADKNQNYHSVSLSLQFINPKVISNDNVQNYQGNSNFSFGGLYKYVWKFGNLGFGLGGSLSSDKFEVIGPQLIKAVLSNGGESIDTVNATNQLSMVDLITTASGELDLEYINFNLIINFLGIKLSGKDDVNLSNQQIGEIIDKINFSDLSFKGIGAGVTVKLPLTEKLKLGIGGNISYDWSSIGANDLISDISKGLNYNLSLGILLK